MKLLLTPGKKIDKKYNIYTNGMSIKHSHLNSPTENTQKMYSWF